MLKARLWSLTLRLYAVTSGSRGLALCHLWLCDRPRRERGPLSSARDTANRPLLLTSQRPRDQTEINATKATERGRKGLLSLLWRRFCGSLTARLAGTSIARAFVIHSRPLSHTYTHTLQHNTKDQDSDLLDGINNIPEKSDGTGGDRYVNG